MNSAEENLWRCSRKIAGYFNENKKKILDYNYNRSALKKSFWEFICEKTKFICGGRIKKYRFSDSTTFNIKLRKESRFVFLHSRCDFNLWTGIPIFSLETHIYKM
jgi:hypothetical protein